MPDISTDAFKKKAQNQWYDKIAHGSFKDDDWFDSMVKNQENGKWIIKATLTDIYDFTEMQTFMDSSGGWSSQAGLGTVANDVATGSQLLGAINPYKVTVEFYTTR